MDSSGVTHNIHSTQRASCGGVGTHANCYDTAYHWHASTSLLKGRRVSQLGGLYRCRHSLFKSITSKEAVISPTLSCDCRAQIESFVNTSFLQVVDGTMMHRVSTNTVCLAVVFAGSPQHTACGLFHSTGCSVAPSAATRDLNSSQPLSPFKA